MCVRLLLGWHGARVCIPGQEEGTSDRMHASRKARTSFGKGDCSGEGWGSRTGSRPSNAQTNARLVCFSRHSESRPPLMETRGKKLLRISDAGLKVSDKTLRSEKSNSIIFRYYSTDRITIRPLLLGFATSQTEDGMLPLELSGWSNFEVFDDDDNNNFDMYS